MDYDNIISLQIDKEGFLSEIKKLANPTDFIGFLDLCARNITMSFRNQVALYKQAKDISNACGIKARVDANQKEFENMRLATVLYYNLSAKDTCFISEYVPIKVVGDAPETYNEGPFSQYMFDDEEDKNITIPDMVAKTGLIIELVPKEKLKHPIHKADYDTERGLIQVAKGLNNRQYSEVLISAFTKFCLESKGFTDKILQSSVIYVVSQYFKVKAQKGIQGVLFHQAFQYSDEEFAQLLEEISIMSFNVVEDLIGQMLSFDETGIVNIYLDEDNVEDFAEFLIEMQQGTEDETTIRILSDLAEKVESSTLNSMNHLLAQKNLRGAVYTYPPFRFERNPNIFD